MPSHPDLRSAASTGFVSACGDVRNCKGAAESNLAIQEGATASAIWNRIVTGELDEAGIRRERENLLSYCGLDSLAMVEIWRALQATSAPGAMKKVNEIRG